MAGKEVGPIEPIAKDDKPPRDIMEFWEDPKNRDLIINAEPLESLFKGKKEEEKEKSPSSPHAVLPPTGDKSGQSTSLSSSPSSPHDALPPTGDKPGQSTSSSSSTPSYVPDDCLTKYPYQSVGKIFWLLPKTRHIMYHTTAFYIGSGQIMTAAHTFDKDKLEDNTCIPKAAIFVPAMSDKEDIHGVNYGHYEIVEIYIHKNHNHINCQPEFDICIVRIANGRKPVEGTKENPTEFKPIQIAPPNSGLSDSTQSPKLIAELKPISLLPYPQPYKDMRKCTLLGYGSKPFTKPVITDTRGKMMIFNIEKVNVRIYNDKMHGVVIMKPAVWQDTSGGPWLNGDNTAIGIQSGCCINTNTTVSPLWTKRLLSENIFVQKLCQECREFQECKELHSNLKTLSIKPSNNIS